MKAFVFDIYRGTVHDGPGLRSTVFFKGCPLNCAWCHNPEGIPYENGVWWERSKCVGCGMCEEICPTGACELAEQGVCIDRGICVSCGKCADVCPAKAMTRIGAYMEVETLAKELLRDAAYYKQFHGGVTASGGEALVQWEAVTELFKLMRENNVHTALDTCGMAEARAFDSVLAYTDLVMYDLKLIDTREHRKWVGVNNDAIVGNLLMLIERIRKNDGVPKLWIRTPLIPNATDSADNIRGIGEWITKNAFEEVSRWELCAFNNSCQSKYVRLSRKWAFADAMLICESKANALVNDALLTGFPRDKLIVTGILRKRDSV